MKFIDNYHDKWHTITGEDGPMVTLTPTPYSLLTAAQWHGVRSQWPENIPVGVTLSNDSDVEDLADDLPRLVLVALHFPKWIDGRAYSQAHLLRSRYRYRGEIRATGEVLVDMLPLLQRTGFDAAVLRGDQSLQAAERALSFFPAFYQGDMKNPRPLFARSPEEAQAAAQEFVHGGASI
jgi:uncharacterized protein (DUF934 family)